MLDWSALARSRRIVHYHQRGHGSSTGAADPADCTWPSLAGDLFAMADHVGGAEPVDWAGSSMGAATLLWAAVRRPERFRRLVLMTPPTVRDTRVASARAYRDGAGFVELQGNGMGGRGTCAFAARNPRRPADVGCSTPTYRRT